MYTSCMKKYIVPTLLATVWIALSEFLRNQLLLNDTWHNHYTDLGLIFSDGPVNGAVWGLWSLLFAACIVAMLRKMSARETGVIAWLMGFVLMWLTIGNLQVLPFAILWLAIPLSIVEVFVAIYIIQKTTKTQSKKSHK